MKNDKVVIYGVKSGSTYHYIGKTILLNSKKNLNKSNVKYQYANSNIRDIIVNNNVEIEQISTTNNQDWYDDKLTEVVVKYKDKHPLLNAQWMLDGKRGYWEGTGGYWQGKQKDKHTINKLSESKYKKVCQYNENGKLIKIWNSTKQPAIEIFKDYKVVNGSATSKLYGVLANSMTKNKFIHNSYWFRENDLIEKYKIIPKSLNLQKMFEEDTKKSNDKKKKPENIKRKQVIRYDENNNVIAIYQNYMEAAYKLKTTIKKIQQLCRGQKSNKYYILKYGEKISQPINITYPKYKVKPLKQDPKPPKEKKCYVKTKTSYTIKHVLNDGNVITYLNVDEAAKKLGVKPHHIRRLCKYNQTPHNKHNIKKYFNVVYGEKKTTPK